MRVQNGRTALVRAGHVVQVPETGVLRAAEVVTILRQSGVSLDEFLDLLCAAKERPAAPTTSGFYTKTPSTSSDPKLDALVGDAVTVRASGEEIRDRVEAAIEASRAARARLEQPKLPDSTRIRSALRRARAETAAAETDRKRGRR